MKKMKCKICNKIADFKKCGYSPNERYECTECNSVFLPLKTRFFGKYSSKDKWISRENWISFLTDTEQKKESNELKIPVKS
ncbi:MAG: hypothetical protein ACOC1P_00715 [Minisyncoccales bacterium]